MKYRVILRLCVITVPSLAQPVTIRFAIGSELATVMTGVTDVHIETNDGPYNFQDVQRLTFQMNLPDTAIVEKLKSRGIEIYLRTKRITPLVIKKAPTKPEPSKPANDSVKRPQVAMDQPKLKTPRGTSTRDNQRRYWPGN